MTEPNHLLQPYPYLLPCLQQSCSPQAQPLVTLWQLHQNRLLLSDWPVPPDAPSTAYGLLPFV